MAFLENCTKTISWEEASSFYLLVYIFLFNRYTSVQTNINSNSSKIEIYISTITHQKQTLLLNDYVNVIKQTKK